MEPHSLGALIDAPPLRALRAPHTLGALREPHSLGALRDASPSNLGACKTTHYWYVRSHLDYSCLYEYFVNTCPCTCSVMNW